MAKSSSMGRQIATYADPKYFRLFVAYAKVNELGKSESMNIMLRDFFNRMPEAERKRILHLAENPITD